MSDEGPRSKGTVENRRSQRVSARVAIQLETGGLSVDGYTAVVNDHGALVLARVHAEPGTVLTVTNRTTGESVPCRVVWSGDETSAHEVKLGLEMLEPRPGFWGLDFASASAAQLVGEP
jgi:hypothetical protein